MESATHQPTGPLSISTRQLGLAMVPELAIPGFGTGEEPELDLHQSVLIPVLELAGFGFRIGTK